MLTKLHLPESTNVAEYSGSQAITATMEGMYKTGNRHDARDYKALEKSGKGKDIQSQKAAKARAHQFSQFHKY